VLLRIESDDERRYVDDLLADANMPLSDEDTSMVDGLGVAELADQSLQAAFQKVFSLESEHVIELHARPVEHADANETADKRIALEKTFGVLLFKGKKLASGTTDLRQRQLDSPDLSLVLQAILPDKFQLGIKSCRLVGSAGNS